MKYGSSEWTSKVQNAIKYLVEFAKKTTYKKGLTPPYISYGDFESTIGLPIGFNDMALFLEDVCQDNMKRKLTKEDLLLSALVATKGTGVPGPGFFSLAKRIGHSKEELKDESIFAFSQRERLFEYYQTNNKI